MRRLSVVAAVLLACASVPRAPPTPEAPPTTRDLLITGRIHTMDPMNPVAASVLVRDGKFACVGGVIECAQMAQRNAETIDLRRGSAIPGLADAHGHVLRYGRSTLELSCAGLSEEDCVERVAERASSVAAGQWVRGHGWDQNLWPGGRFPAERALSAVISSNPVVLEHADGHAIWVNARALEIAGITEDTPDPDGGKILRYADGRPSGILTYAAAALVTKHIPAPSAAEIEEALVAALKELSRAGLTQVHDAGVSAEVLDVYRKLAQEDRLPLRVYAMIDGGAPRGVLQDQMALWRRTPEVGRLTVRAVKLFADGALDDRTAALFKPYADDPSTTGSFVTPPGELRERILAAARAGFQPAVHAAGDRACAEVLHDFTAAGREQGVELEKLRPRIEHLEVLLDHDAHLLKDTFAVASMQPLRAVNGAGRAEGRLGRDTQRGKGAYAWRKVLDFFVPLAFGSDFPAESFDPRLALAAAEERVPRGSTEPWMPEQRLSREQAVRAYTVGAAYAALADDRRGLVKVGYDADLTAFDRDVLSAPAESLRQAVVTYTIVGGRFEYPPSEG